MTHIVYQKPRKSIIGKKKDKSQRVMTEPEGMGKKVLSGRGNLNCDPQSGSRLFGENMFQAEKRTNIKA